MGCNELKLDSSVKDIIRNGVDQQSNVNRIKKELEEKKVRLSYGKIKSYVEKALLKEWNSEAKVWEDKATNVDGQTDFLNKPSQIAETTEPKDKDNEEVIKDSSIDTSINKTDDLFKAATDELVKIETILGEGVDGSTNNEKQQINLFDVSYIYASIYASSSKKVSVNINRKLLEILQKTIGKTFDIDNTSKLINTALIVGVLVYLHKTPPCKNESAKKTKES